MKLAPRFLLLASTLAALAPVALSGCGDDSQSVGLQVVVYGAADETGVIPSELDPFANCDTVRVCYSLIDDDTPESCTEVPYNERQTAIGSLPYDEKLSVSVECRQAVPDETTGKFVKVPVSRGETCPVAHGEGGSKEAEGVYMLPVSTFGPTYDPQAGRVTEPGTDARWGAAIIQMFNGMVLIAGGGDLKSECKEWAKADCVTQISATAELYSPATGVFSPLDPTGNRLMNDKRAFAAAVELPSNEIAIFGGLNATGAATDTVDIFDPVNLVFSPGKKMKKNRAYHTATLILEQDGGYVLLVGGFGMGEAYWEVWNPVQGTVAEGKLAESRWNHTANLVTKAIDPSITASRGMVLITGGEGTVNSAGVRDTMEIFDIQGLAGSGSGYVPEAFLLCSNDATEIKPAKKTMHAAALVPKRHFLYVAGGFSDVNHTDATRDICAFQIVQKSWWAQTNEFLLQKARGGLTATAMPGNQVLFAGGLTEKNSTLEISETVEVLFEYLNPNGDTKIEIGPDDTYPIKMLSGRWMHSALLGCDSKVLILGGLSGSVLAPSIDHSAELFNPQ